MPRPSPQTDRVVAVIEFLAGCTGGATMTEISRALGIDPSSCVHVMAALNRAGFVVREPVDRRYHVGPALVSPGRVAAERYPLLAAARPEMAGLSARFDAPCFAFAPDGAQARLVQHTWAPAAEPTAVRLDETLPLIPPLGLVFAAWDTDAGFEDWLVREPLMTDLLADQYRARRTAVRSLGFVVELAPDLERDVDLAGALGDRPSPYRDHRIHRLLSTHAGGEHVLTDLDADRTHEVVSIGAPVLDADGTVVLSLSLVLFGTRRSGGELAEAGAELRAGAGRVGEAFADPLHPAKGGRS
ncbi:IclR family transcriptional regulator [Aquihabitans daechungensis]|uniref:IclR family transcriptional regulator n=1 Tax=Aquihabitans daechungensis TaxID=1052257 RepID=UPI003B9F7102